ncbi:MAG: toxin [Methyloprofundus sp.]|nr:toxin [Methyloprofundus sp.]
MSYKHKKIHFSAEKNTLLKQERGIGFEDVLLAIEMGHILDDLEHPNIEKYPNQSILIMLLKIKNYVYIVPYVEDEYTIFLKTIIPSRKMNKLYNKAINNEH